jgi:hypothetical protein
VPGRHFNGAASRIGFLLPGVLSTARCHSHSQRERIRRFGLIPRKLLPLRRIGRDARLSDTLEARTGGGGTHFFFALPEGQIIRSSAGKLGPGLDVRAEGAYVVIPGWERLRFIHRALLITQIEPWRFQFHRPTSAYLLVAHAGDQRSAQVERLPGWKHFIENARSSRGHPRGDRAAGVDGRRVHYALSGSSQIESGRCFDGQSSVPFERLGARD